MVAQVQKPAPSFKTVGVVNGDIVDISLDSEQFAGKWIVLAFIPMAWTFVCPTEIIAFSDAIKQFEERNTAVAFASVDSEYSLLAWSNAARKDGGLGNVNFPLLSDKKHTLSKDYGVFLEDAGVALRGLFIIDPKKTVRQITINDLPVGRSVDETLRLIDAFQFTEQFGEVCPANWHKGEATIQPTPKDAGKYFSAKHAQ
ncbi:thioredoxin-like protein [Ascobolus immersus RN42]|uniref:thioredoxin-dependent peroxiredoxin n=1 Tax=Ascobolus immersus RN42 TaxID=1160509 RepID=A0A3N4HPF4_ASCIM|nr:thioredoxin-like protein [Ascobolus immersus RN42]